MGGGAEVEEGYEETEASRQYVYGGTGTLAYGKSMFAHVSDNHMNYFI